MTYTLIDSVTLGSSAASVTFSGIDQSYGDLIISVDASNSGIEDFLMTLNSDTTNANYRNVRMRGNGSTTYSNSQTNRQIATIFTDPSYAQIQLMDYSATDKHTSALARSGLASSQVWAYAWRWANTAAVTSIQLSPGAGTLNTGSTFFLYGIAKAL
tara:strand:- start:128 stop:598 length:471 start_codon:yes stop_codon:yes gene_type:complete